MSESEWFDPAAPNRLRFHLCLSGCSCLLSCSLSHVSAMANYGKYTPYALYLMPNVRCPMPRDSPSHLLQSALDAHAPHTHHTEHTKLEIRPICRSLKMETLRGAEIAQRSPTTFNTFRSFAFSSYRPGFISYCFLGPGLSGRPMITRSLIWLQ